MTIFRLCDATLSRKLSHVPTSTFTGTVCIEIFTFLLDSNLLFYFTSKEDETETTLFLKLNQPSTISEIKVRPIGNVRQWYAGTCKQSCRSRFCCVEPNPFFGPAQAPTHTLLKIFYFDRTLSFFCFFFPTIFVALWPWVGTSFSLKVIVVFTNKRSQAKVPI